MLRTYNRSLFLSLPSLLMGMRHLTKIDDLTPGEVAGITHKAIRISDGQHRPEPLSVRRPGDNVALAVFEKPSLRTRAAWEAGAVFVGAHPSVFRGEEVFTKGKGGEERETVEDVGGHMEGLARFIGARVFKHETIRRLAAAVTRAHVINLLCDKHHPMQALTDVAMILKLFPEMRPSQISVLYVGEWNNVSTSLAQACAMMGIKFVHSGPVDEHLASDEWTTAKRFAADSASSVTYERNLDKAADGVQIVYGDTFVSMGDEQKKAQQLALYGGYQVTPAVMRRADPRAKYLHCAPLYRGIEVAAEVADGEQACVYALGHMRADTQAAVFDFLRRTE